MATERMRLERAEKAADVVERARAFVAERLADSPARDDAVRAVGEIAADLSALDLYLAYEVAVYAGPTEVTCSFTGVSRYDRRPPELDAHTPDGHWPGMAPGRLLGVKGVEIDDGTEIEITLKPEPAH